MEDEKAAAESPDPDSDRRTIGGVLIAAALILFVIAMLMIFEGLEIVIFTERDSAGNVTGFGSRERGHNWQLIIAVAALAVGCLTGGLNLRKT